MAEQDQGKQEWSQEFLMMQALQPDLSAEDLQRFRGYVDTVKWQFAKTYAETWPHEYTIRQWNPQLDDEFNWVVDFIKASGVKEHFYKAIRPYFYIDGMKYWAMGNRGFMYVINRATGEPNPFPPVKVRKKKIE